MRQTTLALALLASLGSLPALAVDTNSLLNTGLSLLGGSTTPKQEAQKVADNAATAADGLLVSALSSKLGITPEQASGGAGLLLGLAQGKLSAEQNSELTAAIPELDQLLASAPQLQNNQTSSLLGAASSLLGGGNDNGLGQLGQLAQLVPGFESLGLSPEMVQQFVPVVLDVVNQQGGNALMSALQSVLLGG